VVEDKDATPGGVGSGGSSTTEETPQPLFDYFKHMSTLSAGGFAATATLKPILHLNPTLTLLVLGLFGAALVISILGMLHELDLEIPWNPIHVFVGTLVLWVVALFGYQGTSIRKAALLCAALFVLALICFAIAGAGLSPSKE
jgi:hypothetical protein